MYRFEIVNHFKKQLRKLTKKNRTLKEKLIIALKNFNREHSIAIGGSVYKMRIQSENGGKSGGYRLYVYVVEIEKILVPVAIYGKNSKENLSPKELNGHLQRIKDELSKELEG